MRKKPLNPLGIDHAIISYLLDGCPKCGAGPAALFTRSSLGDVPFCDEEVCRICGWVGFPNGASVAATNYSKNGIRSSASGRKAHKGSLKKPYRLSYSYRSGLPVEVIVMSEINDDTVIFSLFLSRFPEWVRDQYKFVSAVAYS